MTCYFTSDQHFGHANILKYCNRPFGDINEHDEELIRRHNLMVGVDDDVYMLGDFAFRDPAPILARLNGKKYLCLGNHDKRWRKKLYDCEAFVWIEPASRGIFIGDLPIWISHYPHDAWPESENGLWHLHGHSHGGLSTGHAVGPLAGRCDIGVDCWDFAPVSLERLRAKLPPPRRITP